MDKQPVVTVENVTKTYGKQGEKQTPALKGVSFQVEPGEFVGIMGASGSGKTTLLNILSTLDTPTSGSVRIKGADVTKLKGDALSDFRAKKIGFIFQDFNLLENLTGRENIALPLALQNVSAKKQTEAVDKIAQTLGIERVLDHYPTELSGGQKQRIGIARALYKEAEVLFFDEATSALDNKTEQGINHALETLSLQHRELTLIVIAHRGSSLAFCDRIFDLDVCDII